MKMKLLGALWSIICLSNVLATDLPVKLVCYDVQNQNTFKIENGRVENSSDRGLTQNLEDLNIKEWENREEFTVKATIIHLQTPFTVLSWLSFLTSKDRFLTIENEFLNSSGSLSISSKDHRVTVNPLRRSWEIKLVTPAEGGSNLFVTNITFKFVFVPIVELRVICFDFTNHDEFEFLAQVIGGIGRPIPKNWEGPEVPYFWQNGGFTLLAKNVAKSLMLKWNSFQDSKEKLLTISYVTTSNQAPVASSDDVEIPRKILSVGNYTPGSLWEIQKLEDKLPFDLNLIPEEEVAFRFSLKPRMEIRVICFDFSNQDEFEFRAHLIAACGVLPPTNTDSQVPNIWQKEEGWILVAKITNKSILDKWNSCKESRKKLLTISFLSVNNPPASPIADDVTFGVKPPYIDTYPSGSLWKIEMLDSEVYFKQDLTQKNEIAFKFSIVKREYFVLIYPTRLRDALYICEGRVESDTLGQLILPYDRLRKFQFEFTTKNSKVVSPTEQNLKVYNNPVTLTEEIAEKILKSIPENEKIGLIVNLHRSQNPVNMMCNDYRPVLAKDSSQPGAISLKISLN